jgi:CheY-like chemotaxis protein
MPRTVLVADDDPPILEFVGELLTAEGYDVRLATDGLTALDQALAVPPDLVLTDIHMPGLDGLSLAAHLRERDRGFPVILMSAAPPRPRPSTVGFVRKPFDIGQLLGAVASALDPDA